MAILPEAWFVNFIILSVLLILLLAYLSATARRLRDVGYSGWFTFLSFIPYCVGLIILLFFTTKPSKKENNKYIEDTQSNLGKFLMQSNRSFIGSLLVLALLFGLLAQQILIITVEITIVLLLRINTVQSIRIIAVAIKRKVVLQVKKMKINMKVVVLLKILVHLA